MSNPNTVVTPAQMRADFPEFADTAKYPDSLLQQWLNIAFTQVNAARWLEDTGLLYAQGLELFAAHNIVLEKIALDTANAGGWPGTVRGVVSSESVGPVSVSYDTSAAVELEAGHWNYTTYGQRFVRLARMIGAGPLQTGGAGNSSNGSAVQAWGGPLTGNGWMF